MTNGEEVLPELPLQAQLLARVAGAAERRDRGAAAADANGWEAIK